MIIRKQWNHNKTAILGLVLLFVLLISPAIADEANYFYDDNGRLVRVDKSDNTRALYQYNEVGNLIAIYTETSTAQALPPVLQSIEPDIFLIGNNYNIIITGQNLLTTNSITSDDPNVTVKFIAAIDTKILAILSIANTASAGQANITVTTSYGSASIPINLYGVNITPNEISLFPRSTAAMSVSLASPAPEDLNVSINNQAPDIIETQSSVSIPAGGSADFTVKALKYGTGTINIGNAEATVYVIGGNADEKGALIKSAPVSVSAVSGPVPDNALIQSLPVSVSIDSVFSGTILSSNPVSVIWDVISAGTAVSLPVSIQWTTVSDAITVSLPVSVEMCSDSSVRVVGTSTRYYNTLQSAYDSVSDNETIQAQALTAFTEDLNINRNVSITLEGGYNCDYSSNTGSTELKGVMTISNGTIKVKNFILKK